jgi:L-iditol 2-dehydrogenase
MQALMKVARGVGHVELRDIPEPEPAAGQVKIRVHAAGLCGTDLHIYKDEFRTWPPVVMGHEVAGEVAALGSGVNGLEIGAKVTAETYFSTCGACRYCRSGQVNLCPQRRSIGSAVNGAFTKYLIVPSSNIHRLPDNVDTTSGALTEPLACVAHGVLSTPTVAPGDVAVIAGPGAIGLLTLQVVKSAGARVIVLGAAGDERRLALARELGADFALSVDQEDPLPLLRDLTPEGFGADVVYECAGAGPAAAQLLALVRRRGRYVQLGICGEPIAWDVDQLVYKELTATGSNASTPSSWSRALQLLGSGAVKTAPLITGIFELPDWRQAFDTFENRTGIKTLLRPGT